MRVEFKKCQLEKINIHTLRIIQECMIRNDCLFDSTCPLADNFKQKVFHDFQLWPNDTGF